ncbi:unknown [Bacteroides faecis CAG:32]|nr:unknown [Bacteroides faecis CAG:32]
MIKKIRITRTDVWISQVLMNFQRTGCYPLSVFIITSVLGNFADVYFRIEVCSKCFMMITGITVHNVQILNFIEVMLCCIGSIDAADSRVESATKDSCQTGFFEAVVVGPLPAVFKMSFIFRLVICGIQIIDSCFQTGLHYGKVLIRKSNVNHHFRFKVIE